VKLPFSQEVTSSNSTEMSTNFCVSHLSRYLLEIIPIYSLLHGTQYIRVVLRRVLHMEYMDREQSRAPEQEHRGAGYFTKVRARAQQKEERKRGAKASKILPKEQLFSELLSINCFSFSLALALNLESTYCSSDLFESQYWS